MEEYIDMPDVLLPLIDAMDDVLFEPYKDLLFYVKEFMEGGISVPSPLMVGLKELDGFNEAIERLRKSPYHRYYKEGCDFIQDNDAAIENALVAFMPELSRMAVRVIQKALEISSYRIRDAFAICSGKVFAKMKGIIEKETSLLTDFPGLCTIFDFEGEYALPPSMNVDISFKVKQETKVFTRTEEVPRNWFMKWLFGSETKVVREQQEGIKVPSLDQLLNASLEKLLVYISEDLLGTFAQELNGRVSKGLIEYQGAIEESVKMITIETKERNQKLERYKKRIVKVVQEIEKKRNT
ncbi:MAG: hypothetical protein IJ934_03350 [Acetobacter sp.]|nr:hypothetical protein [Acetobacter sp.]